MDVSNTNSLVSHTHTTLMSGVSNREMCVCGGGRVNGKSLYCLLSFSVNLKLF